MEEVTQVRWSTMKKQCDTKSSNKVQYPLGHRQQMQHITLVCRDIGEYRNPLTKTSSW